jgi:Tol biopolymer transport system component
MLAADLLVACDRGPTSLVTLVPDTVVSPPLLLPWRDLQGQIAFTRGDSLFVIDTRKREVRRLAVAPSGTVLLPESWSPDGMRLATVWFTTTEEETRILDAGSGSVLQTLKGVTCLGWTHDGVLTYMRRDSLYINGQLMLTSLRNEGCPSVSPDGRFAVFLSDDTVIGKYSFPSMYRVDFDTGKRQLVQKFPKPRDSFGSPHLQSPAISPTGQTIGYILFLALTPYLEFWISDVDGSNTRRIASLLSFFSWDWSPNGKQVAVFSTLDYPGHEEERGLFLIDTGDGTVRKLVPYPVTGVAWGSNPN